MDFTGMTVESANGVTGVVIGPATESRTRAYWQVQWSNGVNCTYRSNSAVMKSARPAGKTFSVQLREGVTLEAFAAAVLPLLADRSGWLRDLQDWDGHPKYADFRFAVVPADEPGGCRAEGLNPRTTARIVLTLGDAAAEAQWGAFGFGYSARVTDAAFAAGAGSIGY